MSYEQEMLTQFKMPPRKKVARALLLALFKHGGSIIEFGSEETIVEEIASDFNLTNNQKSAYLETIYRKENRVKRSSLWHRLLFRAADTLAKEALITRPSHTFKLTNKKEWMLTEAGFDQVLRMLKIPFIQKATLFTKSYEVEKLVKSLKNASRPEKYNPFEIEKKTIKTTKEISVRIRGFRKAVIEAYDYRCAICGLKICTPNSNNWEVEAAHIVPRSQSGKNDIWNGLSLCHLHHWAFDAGWFSLNDDYSIIVSPKYDSLPKGYGLMGSYSFISDVIKEGKAIHLPNNRGLYPHHVSIQWHRQHSFCF